MAEKSELGRKIAAGMLLSKFIKSIAEEKTETAEIDGELTVVSKAEALARLIWKAALGYIEKHIDDKGNESTHICPPDRVAWQLLFDRMEGKVSTTGEADKSKGAVAGRVSQQGKNRIADASGLKDKDKNDG